MGILLEPDLRERHRLMGVFIVHRGGWVERRKDDGVVVYWGHDEGRASADRGSSLNVPLLGNELRNGMIENMESDFSDTEASTAKDYRKRQTCPRCGTTFWKPPGQTIHCAAECPKLKERVA